MAGRITAATLLADADALLGASTRRAADPAAALAVALADETPPPQTRYARRSDWERWSQWATSRGEPLLPADPDAVAQWVASLAAGGFSPKSIERFAGTLSWAHKVTGCPIDLTRAKQVLREYRAARTAAGIPNARRVTQIDTTQLRRMVEALPATPVGTRNRALLLLAFATAARVNELVALRIGDILKDEHNRGMVVRFAGGDTVAVPFGYDRATCPVTATLNWLAYLLSQGITDPNAYLMPPFGSHGKTLRDTGEHIHARGTVSVLVQSWAKAAGIQVDGPASYLGTRSLRAGFAAEAYIAGADLLSIARHGRWIDNSPRLAENIQPPTDPWRRNPLTLMAL